MRKILTVALAAVIIIVTTGGCLAWTYLSSQNNDQPTVLSLEEIRDSAMLYLAANHSQTIQAMDSLSWVGGKQDTNMLGAETYAYQSGNWSVEISYPIVPNPLYTISIDYSFRDVTINWNGTYQEGALSETSHEIINLNPEIALTQEHIRYLAIAYTKTFHNETSTLMPNLIWTGGRTTAEGLVGSETYTYQSSGWTVTIQYPVVLKPVYSVTVEYTTMELHESTATVTWKGTIENGIIRETAYSYNA